ncbi:hypothetical protein VTN02DRAFT_5714 [Thermoascus thermophilus]
MMMMADGFEAAASSGHEPLRQEHALSLSLSPRLGREAASSILVQPTGGRSWEKNPGSPGPVDFGILSSSVSGYGGEAAGYPAAVLHARRMAKRPRCSWPGSGKAGGNWLRCAPACDGDLSPLAPTEAAGRAALGGFGGGLAAGQALQQLSKAP